MKVIISHDIDHLNFCEHWHDLFIPKYLVRAKLEWLMGKISFMELWLRWKYLFRGRYHNIPELLDFDASMKIPSTFFIGFSKGRGLVYPLKRAGFWLKIIKSRGFRTGVHGNAGSEFQAIKKERFLYIAQEGPVDAGIRMHYLNMAVEGKTNMNKAGYMFDSSEYTMDAPYCKDGFWEFPVQIMDTYELEAGRRWQRNTLEQARQSTMERIKQAGELGLPYLVVIFHDCYFSNAYITWREWYKWLIEYLKSKDHEFISFQDAIHEMEKTIV